MADALRYTTPAKSWQQGLPIGNGRLSSVVISDVHREVWRLADITFWSGQREPSPEGYGGRKALNEIQGRYFAKDYDGGQRLAERYLQPEKKNYGTNLGVASVHLEFDHRQGADDSIQRFSRSLSLDKAIAAAQYKANGYQYQRESWVSHPQQLMVSRLTTDSPEGMSLTLFVTGETEVFDAETSTSPCHISFRTQAVENVHSDGKCGVRGHGLLSVTTVGGSAAPTEAGKYKALRIEHASSVIVMIAFNTDFKQPANDKLESLCAIQLEQAQRRTYEELRQAHIADYQHLYKRVSIDLGETEQSFRPTDERLLSFRDSRQYGRDPALFTLFFQYGRYLTIAGNREDSPLPLHLQGIWNDGEANRMNWSCDYHLDINTQMNYFPTEVSNLGECQSPLLAYIEFLAQAGESTAEQFYGCAGWVAHVFSNAWGFTDPGWETSWGLNVTGGLWIASLLMEKYEYDLDRTFLVTQAYPVLKKSAEFFLQYMTVHPDNGYLVTGPSVSPENSFFVNQAGRPKKEHHLSLAPTIDIVLVRDLFRFCIRAATELGIDTNFVDELRHALGKLPPLQIGGNGQLQEWLEDFEEAQPGHRHLSHTIALCRSDQITPRHTPDLARAARVTLENRQARADLEDIEFTAAMFGLNFARLNDGEAAFKQLGHLIGKLCFDNLLTYSKPGVAGSETNIFVIDGNFGGAAVVAEMILRSSTTEIDLLPALPSAWPTGFVRGLRAKGNIEVDIKWRQGRLVEATLRPFSSGTTTVYYGSHCRQLAYEVNCLIKLDCHLEDI